MIVAPGGGFRTLMMSYEGVDVAKRLNQMGVDAFVLSTAPPMSTRMRCPQPPRPEGVRPHRSASRPKRA